MKILDTNVDVPAVMLVIFRERDLNRTFLIWHGKEV
jgi:hypothetical protein